jgi:hypothetical protein
MKKICPRCNSSFECQNNNILECDCITVTLSAEDYQYVSNNYTDCLCIKCLNQIKNGTTAFAKTICRPSVITQ